MTRSASESPASGAGSARGPTDPRRQQRIAQAAIAVVAERGIEGLTHRAVAAAAGVPLGSTTYHFSNREEMLEAAMQTAAANSARKLRVWSDTIAADDDLVTALVGLLARESTHSRDRMVVGYELYLAALKRPALQPAAAEWSESLRTELGRHTDATTAAALAVATEGLMLIILASGRQLDCEEAETIFRRIVDR